MRRTAPRRRASAFSRDADHSRVPASSRDINHGRAAAASSRAADLHRFDSLEELVAAAIPEPPRGLRVELRKLSSLQEIGEAVFFLRRMQQDADWEIANLFDLEILARYARSLQLRLNQALGLQGTLKEARDSAAPDVVVSNIVVSHLVAARARVDHDFPTARELNDAYAARAEDEAARAKDEAARAAVHASLANFIRLPVVDAWHDDAAARAEDEASRAKDEAARAAVHASLANFISLPVVDAWHDDAATRAGGEASHAALADALSTPVLDLDPWLVQDASGSDLGARAQGEALAVADATPGNLANAVRSQAGASRATIADASCIGVPGGSGGGGNVSAYAYVEDYAVRAVLTAKDLDARIRADTARRALADELADVSRTVLANASRALADTSLSFLADASRGRSGHPPTLRQAFAFDVAAKELAEKAERMRDFDAIVKNLVEDIRRALEAPVVISDRALRLM